VGVDLYRDESNEATYAREVRALHRFGKPVVITEFGCCAYRGADKRGGEVKVLAPETGLGYERTGHFEPKLAFRTLARRYAP
jgi:hypothetical protein